MTQDTPKILWTPGQDLIKNSNLTSYIAWLQEAKSLHFSNYDELWKWSVDEVDAFWESIYEYFEVIDHGKYNQVTSGGHMPGVRWFEGSEINYAEHIFRHAADGPAIIFQREGEDPVEVSWDELKQKTAAFAEYLLAQGVEKGDRVVGYIPNIPEATIAFLATCSIGAVWSSCSPDFGASSVVDRFLQIAPKVFVTVDGYQYGGKMFDRTAVVEEVINQLPSVKAVVEIPYLTSDKKLATSDLWEACVSNDSSKLTFTPVPFSHPIWVLYSSGTTGQPKAITHSQGGVLLEHLKYVSFHNDVRAGERYFWYTTTGWMMWNFVQATLLCGATIVLYDGSPGFPDIKSLWKMAADLRVNHFGTSAPFIVACMKAKVDPASEFDLEALRSISSTGSPLPPEGFSWVYDHVKKDVWLCSMSGGTDVCSAFVGGCPVVPLYEGEIQRRALGCAMYAFDEKGTPQINSVGEMVVTKPMPSMPIYFWNDTDQERYKESYFEMFPHVWRHGDWLEITDRNTLIIKGRSDATLNRHGIRIGTAEIYQSMSKVEAIQDSLVVNLELDGGHHYMPLFVVMKAGYSLSESVKKQIAQQLKADYTSRHVPDEVIEVTEIPLTISGKKMEAPVKKILMGHSAASSANLGAMKNPHSLQVFENFYTEKLKAH
ncbi:acetoacetate--CoA ligase [Marinoscillum furvescens]|nr:acetoacetate--CoA ligase [Marinoscillum furvescens]